ncbi:MAG: Rieske 2Fe-2S domain-containing protein [bacterium]
MIIVPVIDIDSDRLDSLEKELKSLGLPIRRVGCGSRPLLAAPGAYPGAKLIRELKALGEVERLVPMGDNIRPIELITRRTFLDYAIGGAVVVGAGVLGASVVAASYPPRHRSHARKDVVIPRSRLAQGSAIRFSMGGQPAILVRLGKKYYALSSTCTHKDTCQVEWSATHHRLLCPCHNGAFDVKGNVIDGPPPRPLQSYRVAVIGNSVHIQR